MPSHQSESTTATRPTIIEVWQKRSKVLFININLNSKNCFLFNSKSPVHERSRSRQRTGSPGPDFDFERFRNEILQAIE